MSDALRQLLAEFVVEVDKAGELAKGNAAIDALKRRLEELQAAAKPAAKSVGDAFAGLSGRINAATGKSLSLLGAQALGGRSDSNGFADLALGVRGKQFGPTRETLNAGRAAMVESERAAQQYAGTLKGRLAAAVKAVRDGFNGGGSSGEGPGLIDRLSDFRTQLQLLAGSAVVVGVKRLVDSIGDIKEGAQRLGVSTDQFQRLEVLAGQSNTSVEALGTAFRNLSNAAVQPTKATTAAFTALGVTVKDKVTGRFKSANDLFFDTTAALAGVTDETKRNALAQDLLGRSALELKPLFADGTAAVEAQRKALGDLNVISEETVTQADDLSDSWKTLGPRLLKAAEPLLKVLIPALAKLTEWVFNVIDVAAKWIKQTDLTSVALTALGAVIVLKVLPWLELMVGLGGGVTTSLLSMAGAGAKAALSFLRLALPLLAIEDFITFLRGGDSETGRLLDAVFGKGTSEGTLKTIKELAGALKDVWKYLLGDGLGEQARTLYRDLSDAVSLLVNDILKLVGIGEGGINGPFKLGGDSHKLGDLARFVGHLATGDIVGSAGVIADALGGGGGLSSPQTMAAPALPPVGFYGPPTAGGSVAGNKAITIGDTNVSIIMGQYGPPSAPDVGRAVAGAVADDRNKLIAQYGGF